MTQEGQPCYTFDPRRSTVILLTLKDKKGHKLNAKAKICSVFSLIMKGATFIRPDRLDNFGYFKLPSYLKENYSKAIKIC